MTFYNFATEQKQEEQAMPACIFDTKPITSFKTRQFGNISIYAVRSQLENPIGSGDGDFIAKNGTRISVQKDPEKIANRSGIFDMFLIDFAKPDKSRVKKYYPRFETAQTIALHGKAKGRVEASILFLQNEDGNFAIGIKSPELFSEIVKNLSTLYL